MRDFDEAILAVLDSRGVPIWVDHAIRQIRPDRILVDVADAERTMAPIKRMLDLVGDDGVALTAAGYLRPADVRTLIDEIDIDRIWRSRSTREVDVFPIQLLRESVLALKLAHRRKGRLLLTKKGRSLRNDPVALWWHIADALPLDRDGFAQTAAVLELLALIAGDQDDVSVPDTLFLLGWQTQTGEAPRYFSTRTGGMLRALGLKNGWLETEQAPESARTLARAALTQASEGPPTVDEGETVDRDCLQIVVTLDTAEPPIWRRLLVPGDLSLAQFHLVLQGAMGWTDSHLHQFEIHDTRYGLPDDEWPESAVSDESAVTLAQILHPGDTAEYEYDFGDGWRHTITVEARIRASGAPRCLEGARACPLEDVGGVGGYEELLGQLKDARGSLLEWAPPGFDPELFSPARANDLIALNLHGTMIQKLTHGYNQA